MLLIVCPHCGPRNDAEFTFRGEITRRPPPDTDPAAWRRYLYFRENRAGWQSERWFHVAGCRRFLEVERNTLTNEIRRVVDVGQK
ncbi:MAG TPA: sarcosine oxidase subunit delta [Acidimicrobiia bacterium]|nr:sarcosine oxidase subunit delta [Acidimicrobiia bacterium]